MSLFVTVPVGKSVCVSRVCKSVCVLRITIFVNAVYCVPGVSRSVVTFTAALELPSKHLVMLGPRSVLENTPYLWRDVGVTIEVSDPGNFSEVLFRIDEPEDPLTVYDRVEKDVVSHGAKVMAAHLRSSSLEEDAYKEWCESGMNPADHVYFYALMFDKTYDRVKDVVRYNEQIFAEVARAKSK